jgi:hypothetical protein
MDAGMVRVDRVVGRVLMAAVITVCCLIAVEHSSFFNGRAFPPCAECFHIQPDAMSDWDVCVASHEVDLSQ